MCSYTYLPRGSFRAGFRAPQVEPQNKSGASAAVLLVLLVPCAYHVFIFLPSAKSAARLSLSLSLPVLVPSVRGGDFSSPGAPRCVPPAVPRGEDALPPACPQSNDSCSLAVERALHLEGKQKISYYMTTVNNSMVSCHGILSYSTRFGYGIIPYRSDSIGTAHSIWSLNKLESACICIPSPTTK